MTEQGWFRALTPDVIRSNPYLGLLFNPSGEVSTKVFRVTTINVWRSLTDAKTTAMLNRALDMGHVVGMQELITDREKDLAKRAVLRKGMASFIQNENGVAWHGERFARLNSHTLALTPDGGGDRNRDLSTVVLKDRQNDKVLCVMNTHLTPQSFTKHPERRPLWIRQVRLIGEAIRKSADHCDALILMGDMNADWRNLKIRAAFNRELEAPMLMDTPDTGTFGSALYDYMMREKGSQLRNVSARVSNVASDHDAVTVTYNWK